MLALEIDYEDVELDLSEEPSAVLPNQGSVARPEMRGPGNPNPPNPNPNPGPTALTLRLTPTL